MSYTGESYNGKKYIHAILTENQELRLDDIICKVGAGTNSRRLNIKTVSSQSNIVGVSVVQQNTAFVAPSLNYNAISTTGWTEILPGYFFDLNGSLQKVTIRTERSNFNFYQAFYIITIVAGVGNNASGFNKFSLTIERL